MNISLTNELEDYISKQVKTGHYKSASEVIREALRNQIRSSMVCTLNSRMKISRQQVADGQMRLADADYFEGKRNNLLEKYQQS